MPNRTTPSYVTNIGHSFTNAGSHTFQMLQLISKMVKNQNAIGQLTDRIILLLLSSVAQSETPLNNIHPWSKNVKALLKQNSSTGA
jgi:hypothetical protein